MTEFINDDFLLKTPTAQRLYHRYAEKLPIIDYHCHINPRDIAENHHFENITRLWLSADHYKWRLMRANGIDEKYITGCASDREKFQKWSETLELAIGNPIYHWSHMELKRYFDYDGILCGDTADDVWELCNERLKTLRARNFITMSNVRLICTTDDPVDDLRWHKKIAGDGSFDVHVLPSWRPDKAMSIEKADFPAYIKLLSETSGTEIGSFNDLKTALLKRMSFFEKMGCRSADHSFEKALYRPDCDSEIESIFESAMRGNSVKEADTEKYKTALLAFLANEYKRLGWVMQLHYGCDRNINPDMCRLLGPDTGYDSINAGSPSANLGALLGALGTSLTKTIIYSLNPSDNGAVDSVAGCFRDVVHGCAWWFNDSKPGLEAHLTNLASMGLLGKFTGMLTDSRSLLSYSRHEYFRRIFCNLIGDWVENGEYPDDEKALSRIVSGVCFDNTVNFFNFKL